MSAEVKNVETSKLLDAVSWEWQPLEPILAEMAMHIPPGRGLRKYQQRRNSEQARKGTTAVASKALSEDEQIASGARQLARSALHSQSRRIEVETVDGVEMVRFINRRATAELTEGQPCPTCHHPFEIPTPKTLPRRESGKRKRTRGGKVIRPVVPAWDALRRAQ
jgi:hypothetical protein